MSINILICGFMGSGKSTLLSSLMKQSMGFHGFDLDFEICRFLGIDPDELGEWINQHTLPVFRELEAQILAKILGTIGPKLIALGGGTLEAPGVMQMIRGDSRNQLLFLNVDFDTCLSRIGGDANRPLLAQGRESLKKLHEERLVNYRQANLILNEAQIKEIEGLESLVHNLEGL